MVLIHKKDDLAECRNYCPFCLFAAGRRVSAMLLLHRFLDAGGNFQLWTTQFAFRKERGTADALHCVRRAGPAEEQWIQYLLT